MTGVQNRLETDDGQASGQPRARTRPPIAAAVAVRQDDSDLGWVADLLAAHREEVMQRWVEVAAQQPFHFGRRELAISNNLAQVYDAVVVLLGAQPGTADAGTAGVDPAAFRAA